MFCGKCGKELDNNVLFCPDCGTKINNEPNIGVTYTKPKKSFKKIRNALICVLIVGAILFSGIKVIGFIKSIPSDDEIMLASNNSMNENLAATDGKWLFYFGDGNEGLYREKLSNGKQRKVVMPGEVSGELFYLGGKLYVGSMSSVSAVDKNGKELFEVPNTTFCEKKFKTDGKKCYFDCFDPDVSTGICSQKLDGKKLKELSDISVSNILYYDDTLYLLSPYGSVNDLPNEHKGVTKMDTDGSDAELILDYCPSYFVFGEDKIYYTNNGYLFSMDYDGSNQRQFGSFEVGSGLNVYDGYIYYVDREDSFIHKVSIEDNLSNTVLNDCRSESINIVGDWIVYRNTDDNSSIYKMKPDGSDNQFLSR